jgi:hypothetical protein
MQLAGVKPNFTTLPSILLPVPKWENWNRERASIKGIEDASAPVNMHEKCGSIDKACELCGKMPQRHVIP